MEFATAAELHKAYKAATISTEIHPDDTMYRIGPNHYGHVGESAINVILSALTLSWRNKVLRVLDLACGYGRVGRHLRAAFPEAELHFCDLEAPAADFCAKTFNGHAIHSVPDLTKVALPTDLDVIWIGSLFTHVDRERTEAWLAYLVQHLRTSGIIVATFHGHFSANVTDFGNRVDMAKLRRDFDETGYAFHSYVGWDNYGVSLSKPSTILDMADAIPGTKVISYSERGWANNHDVLCLARDDRLKPWGAA